MSRNCAAKESQDMQKQSTRYAAFVHKKGAQNGSTSTSKFDASISRNSTTLTHLGGSLADTLALSGLGAPWGRQRGDWRIEDK